MMSSELRPSCISCLCVEPALILNRLTDHGLNPARIFSSLALFNSLRIPLNFLPLVIGQVIDANASVKRIQVRRGAFHIYGFRVSASTVVSEQPLPCHVSIQDIRFERRSQFLLSVIVLMII
jgi:hypothetical protein